MTLAFAAEAGEVLKLARGDPGTKFRAFEPNAQYQFSVQPMLDVPLLDANQGGVVLAGRLDGFRCLGRGDVE